VENRYGKGRICLEDNLRRPILYPLSYSRTLLQICKAGIFAHDAVGAVVGHLTSNNKAIGLVGKRIAAIKSSIDHCSLMVIL
jgi:hypothetical protein